MATDEIATDALHACKTAPKKSSLRDGSKCEFHGIIYTEQQAHQGTYVVVYQASAITNAVAYNSHRKKLFLPAIVSEADAASR
ncbi:hypothetical protein SPI_04194 [Niveomyces insectorum RCEF 264]|uniref:Uncharacterized protein n=1 Tax=Niveomyces insectorum RCEF 264 TaxID=1081102 RepID=A0A167VIF1_9HYPO|nr:hypothetical protein SPI_04194 [Niveomyces insectorum RCEF 264]